MTTEQIQKVLAAVECKIEKARQSPGQVVKVKSGWYVAFIDGDMYEFDCVDGEGDDINGWNLKINDQWANNFRTFSAAKKALGL